MWVQKGPHRSHAQHFRDQLIHQIDWERFLYIRGKWHMVAYSLTSISCIFELFCFLTSAPLSLQLIRVSISHYGRPFKLWIQSFNLYCSAYHLLRGIATLSVLLHVYVVTCSDVYLAIDWLILGCTDGNQRTEISSLFNALLLWDIPICSTIEGLDPSRNEKGAKRKKNMVWRRKREKGQVRFGTPAGPLETHLVSLMDDNDV